MQFSHVFLIYYHTSFQDCILAGTSVAPTSDVRRLAVLLLFIVEIKSVVHEFPVV
jgi:hypothetical protein